jgi:adenine-specific DNA-methyltransferase
LQDNIAYWREFEKLKVYVPEISGTVNYCVSKINYHCNNKTSFIVDNRAYFLCAVLNSPISNWFALQTYPSKQGGFMEFTQQFVSKTPIPMCSHDKVSLISDISEAITSSYNTALEQVLNGLVYELYFPDDLHERGLHLFDATRGVGLERLSDLEGEKLAQAAAEFTRQHLAPGQPLRVMLSDLQTLDVVRIIEGKN